MELKSIMLSEISQAQKDKLWSDVYTESEKVQLPEAQYEGGTRGYRVGQEVETAVKWQKVSLMQNE